MIRWTWFGHSVSIELLVWMVLSLVSFSFSAYCLRAARHDLRYQVLSGLNGVREIVAKGNLRREWSRLSSATAYIYVGIHAYLNSPPSSALPKVPLHQEVVALGFLFGSLMVTLNSVSDYRDRKRVLEHLNGTH